MSFTNSLLAVFKRLSPNVNPRNHEIDTVSIHCVVGQLSVESMGEYFSHPDPVNGVSCNYCIGSDGRIGLIADEASRSWCSSSRTNDHRAITIECACDPTHPYAVNDAVMNSLIKLLADVCKRNNIEELKWKGDKSLIGQVDKQNMTVHRWFKNKACPGDYLYNAHGEIARKVNEILNPAPVPAPTPIPVPPSDGSYMVKVNVNDLRIRKGPGTNYGIAGMIKDMGSYTIVATTDGWGQLKSGAGWIYLKYTTVISGTVTIPYRSHTVKRGDSLWKIANTYLGNGARYPEIKSLNGLTSDEIDVGMVLNIPN